MSEGDGDDTAEDGRIVATRAREVQVPSARTELQPDEIVALDEPDDSEWAADDEAVDPDDRVWERPPPRYRAGRGGFDAEAAALAARARYTFRQRVVLLMLVAAVVTGIVAGVAMRSLWWAHGAIDVLLVGYLVYLRRQVRLEEAIRARRAARMAGTRRLSAAEDPELDEWAERGREAVDDAEDDAVEDDGWGEESDEDDEDDARLVHDGHGTSTPDFAPPVTPPVAAAPVVEEERPALPRLRPTPPPPIPAGTTLVDDEDDELMLDDGATPGYRRAAGQ